jgi:sigma-E factor negative regulatory protein RseC
MRELGIVKSITASTATITIRPHGGCRNCQSRSGCAGHEGKEAVLEAINPIGAQPGDRVEIEVPAATTMGGAFLIFGVPVAGAIIGYFAGAANGRGETGGMYGSLLGVVGSFLLVWISYRLFLKNNMRRPYIVRLADAAECTNSPGQ